MHPVAQMVLKKPELLERLLAKSTGSLGEIIVADAISKLGYKVLPTNNNARQSDLLVTSPNGTEFSVEVKSDRSRRPTWFVKTVPDLNASTIWCLVSAPREATELPDPEIAEIFVLTVEETQTIWLDSEWNKNNPTNGDIRRKDIPDEALNAWSKLPN